jgi:cell division septum initiation protein DivIVA
MLDNTLVQLEQLVSELLQQNQAIADDNARIRAELRKAREENDSLQLAAMEQEEKSNATAERLQALVRRVSESRASA